MALGTVLALTVVAVCLGFVGTCAVCLDRAAVRRTRAEFRPRLREVAPFLGAALAFFLVKRLTHPLSLQISLALDWDITAEIHAVEGPFVAALQDVVPVATLEFFSAMYMFGFPYLLVTAPLLYFALPSRRPLKELLVAYLCNYLVGTICYTLFVAYGPRNHLDSVQGLMYDAYPQTQEMTAAISAGTDVFPSLHTSLAVVVALFAWRTREQCPRWFPLAAFVTTGVVVSTMYLGIHWAVDVVAGIVLAVWSVFAAERIVGRVEDRRGRRSADRERGVPSDADVGD